MNWLKTWWAKLFGESDTKKIERFKREFKHNDVVMPKDPQTLPTLQVGGLARKFTAPRTVDLRDYCTRTENQGSKPWCAAYTAAGWAENILWRKNDFITEIDPAMIYREAKMIDGSPDVDGTSLDAVLTVLLNHRYFDPSVCQMNVIWNTAGFEDAIKYAIHKFGACLLACNITEEWYLLGGAKTSVTGKNHNTCVGGHAILCCGYNKDGVIIQNSWGEEWGSYGFGLITWEAMKRQFLYAAVLSNCLNNMRMN